jgi:hypothetical protein
MNNLEIILKSYFSIQITIHTIIFILLLYGDKIFKFVDRILK